MSPQNKLLHKTPALEYMLQHKAHGEHASSSDPACCQEAEVRAEVSLIGRGLLLTVISTGRPAYLLSVIEKVHPPLHCTTKSRKFPLHVTCIKNHSSTEIKTFWTFWFSYFLFSKFHSGMDFLLT
ncbi:hypothetical protein ATANTOWER_002364 [Ataeniobius toweri]|uniref:Uncharacterized protein n=1 Tax=Ataeniobius toweri TaxID=208326 RepID=A0ABU7B4C1_9TELE|nr:hypothetical protein [Ataeniobius toweri]